MASNGTRPLLIQPAHTYRTLAGVARYTDHFFSHRQFYEDAAAGTLPEFSWLNAKEEACDHPCHDIAKGERAVKDIYEALRAGPKWQNTL